MTFFAASHEAWEEQVPTGVVTLEQFIRIYERFFPFGDCAPFARLVFRRFDVDESGGIDFAEYIRQMSVVSRGRLEERLKCTNVMFKILFCFLVCVCVNRDV